MAIVVMIVCVVLWLVIQKNLHDNGITPLSRGQLRYLRRKSRRMGVDVSDTPYQPRRGTHPFPTTEATAPESQPQQPDAPPATSDPYQKRSEWPSPIPPGWTPPGYVEPFKEAVKRNRSQSRKGKSPSR